MSPSRQLLILGAVLAAVGLADFASRVYVGRDDALRRFAVPAAPAVPPHRGTAEVQARLGEWLALGAGAAPAADEAGAFALRLAGTFQQQGRRFAVIMATPRGAVGAPQTHRVAVGETLLGRTVREIRPGAVILDAPGGQEELAVFQRAERPRT